MSMLARARISLIKFSLSLISLESLIEDDNRVGREGSAKSQADPTISLKPCIFTHVRSTETFTLLARHVTSYS